MPQTPRFPELLNELAKLRKPARFLEGEWKLSKDDAATMLATTTEMLAVVTSAVPERPPLPAM